MRQLTLFGLLKRYLVVENGNVRCKSCSMEWKITGDSTHLTPCAYVDRRDLILREIGIYQAIG